MGRVDKYIMGDNVNSGFNKAVKYDKSYSVDFSYFCYVCHSKVSKANALRGHSHVIKQGMRVGGRSTKNV